MNLMKNKLILLPISVLILVGCQTGGTSSSATYDSYWSQAFLNVDLAPYTQTELVINSELEDVSVTKGVVLTENEMTKGFAYEATVRGFVGNITFQLGIYDGLITNFNLVSDREHSSIGGLTLNALKTQLRGLEPNFSTIQTKIASTTGRRTGRSGTYDPVMETIAAITLHYLAQID
jgi:uncharacterized protein with FMN-binding domain